MVEVFLFIFRYKIKKEYAQLGKHCREFFKLSKKAQRKVLDIYFRRVEEDFDVMYYFDNEDSRYYENGKEISFFDSYYFCKKIILLNICNIRYIDKFKISLKKVDYLVHLMMEIIEKDGIKIRVSDILMYPFELPKRLSGNVLFMRYLVDVDLYNIKYMTYLEGNVSLERELIREVIDKDRGNDFVYENFCVRDRTLPEVLVNNIDFIIYLVENDIKNVVYFTEKILRMVVDSELDRVIHCVIRAIKRGNADIEIVESNEVLAGYLNKSYNYLNYIIGIDVGNVKYVMFYELTDEDRKKIIDYLALKLVRENIDFVYDNYPFKKLLLENYMFMAYLIDRDKRNINKMLVSNQDEINKLVDIYLNKYKRCKFDIRNYMDASGEINRYLVSNRHMISYLIRNDNEVFRYIDFSNLVNAKKTIDYILRELDRKDFVFNNEVFLRDGKYPIVLSNSYRFMKYVIDKNFNNLAYINISMIDKRELKRIINYACRMVYYIRGEDRSLNFDIEGYFKGSDVIEDDYFQECYKCL